MRIICILVGVYRTFISTTAGYRGHWISGCNYKTAKEETPDNVHAIKCERCGHYSISWSWGSLAHIK